MSLACMKSIAGEKYNDIEICIFGPGLNQDNNMGRENKKKKRIGRQEKGVFFPPVIFVFVYGSLFASRALGRQIKVVRTYIRVIPLFKTPPIDERSEARVEVRRNLLEKLFSFILCFNLSTLFTMD